MRNFMGLQATNKYSEYMPGKVKNFKGTTIMWDVPVIRYRTILANRPYIMLLHDKKERTCLLTNIAIADDSNVKRKEI